jgi:hypothetical protein
MFFITGFSIEDKDKKNCKLKCVKNKKPCIDEYRAVAKGNIF